MDTVNPLLPTGYDIAWSIVAIAIAVFAVVALVSLARSAKRLTTIQALVWTLLVIFVPLVGAAAWLFVGRRAVAPSRNTMRSTIVGESVV